MDETTELETEVQEVEVKVQEVEVQEAELEKKLSWAAFVEGDVANFFTGYKLEKMTLEDGNGNKAKLGRTKDCGIKIEYTSTVLI